jgi:hypothetical protein
MSTEVFIPYKPHTATLPPFGRTHKKPSQKRRKMQMNFIQKASLPQSDFWAASDDHVVLALTLLEDDIGDGLWLVTLNDYGPGARDRLSFASFSTKEAAETFIAAQKRAPFC